jgi:hypothetical protein
MKHRVHNQYALGGKGGYRGSQMGGRVEACILSFVEQCVVSENAGIFVSVLLLSHCYRCPVVHFQVRRSLYSISGPWHHYTVFTEVGSCTYSKLSLIHLQLIRMSDNPDQKCVKWKMLFTVDTYFKRHMALRKTDESLVCSVKTWQLLQTCYYLRSKQVQLLSLLQMNKCMSFYVF